MPATSPEPWPSRPAPSRAGGGKPPIGRLPTVTGVSPVVAAAADGASSARPTRHASRSRRRTPRPDLPGTFRGDLDVSGALELVPTQARPGQGGHDGLDDHEVHEVAVDELLRRQPGEAAGRL